MTTNPHHKLDTTLIRLSKKLDILEYLNPTNDSLERKKFLEAYANGEVYNPQYKYKKLDFQPERVMKKLDSLQTDDRIYTQIIDHLKLLCTILTHLGENQTIELYEPPTRELYQKAKRRIPTSKDDSERSFITSYEAKKIFQHLLELYNMDDWEIHLRKSITANALVRSAQKTIYIKQKEFSFREINALRAHEIETHALRSQNGYQQSYRVLGYLGLPGYLPSEEGLATIMEELTGNISSGRLRSICIRVIAVYKAMSHSFYDVFKEVKERYNFSSKSAYTITKRVKRGLCDTSLPGGFLKDHVYFLGRERVNDFVQNGGDIRLLFAGKIGIEHISLFKQGLIKRPDVVPTILGNDIFKKILFNNMRIGKSKKRN